jgi:hypothetical protein
MSWGGCGVVVKVRMKLAGGKVNACQDVRALAEHRHLTCHEHHKHSLPLSAPTMAAMHKAAANTLRAAVRPTLSRRIPALARHETTASTPLPDPPVPLSGVMFRGEETYLTEAIRRDNPDYTVAIDYRTS